MTERRHARVPVRDRGGWTSDLGTPVELTLVLQAVTRRDRSRGANHWAMALGERGGVTQRQQLHSVD